MTVIITMALFQVSGCSQEQVPDWGDTGREFRHSDAKNWHSYFAVPSAERVWLSQERSDDASAFRLFIRFDGVAVTDIDLVVASFQTIARRDSYQMLEGSPSEHFATHQRLCDSLPKWWISEEFRGESPDMESYVASVLGDPGPSFTGLRMLFVSRAEQRVFLWVFHER